MLELGSRQNMTVMDTKRARGKCIAKLTRWFVRLVEFLVKSFRNFTHCGSKIKTRVGRSCCEV